MPDTTALYRPVGPKELALIEASGFREFPPRLPDQPIFYPVLNKEYAIQIARDWNVRASGVGFVTRFHVETNFLQRYQPRPRREMERLTENKIVLIVRETRLEELKARFNTVSQARFYVEQLGGDFGDYEQEDVT